MIQKAFTNDFILKVIEEALEVYQVSYERLLKEFHILRLYCEYQESNESLLRFAKLRVCKKLRLYIDSILGVSTEAY